MVCMCVRGRGGGGGGGTRLSGPDSGLAPASLLSTVMVKMEWDRDESLFIAVAAVCLFLRPTWVAHEHVRNHAQFEIYAITSD